LRHSLKLGMAENPPKVARAPKIAKLAENNVRKGFFGQDEYKAMRDALPAHVSPVLTLAYYTGMRKGEMLNLRWEQVDLVENVIRLETGETKNGESREVALDGELLETIRMQRSIRDAQHPTCEWVFFSDRGKQIQDFRGAWERACKKVGLWDPTKERKTKKATSKKKLVPPPNWFTICAGPVCGTWCAPGHRRKSACSSLATKRGTSSSGTTSSIGAT
jgi:integrase